MLKYAQQYGIKIKEPWSKTKSIYVVLIPVLLKLSVYFHGPSGT